MNMKNKTFLLSILSVMLVIGSTYGQTDASTKEEDGQEDRTLIYSVNRFPERPFDTQRAVRVITTEDIIRKNARTLPELLMEEAGLFIQQTNYGGGAPIIRGLMGKQILILVNGVRLNTATYRFGPLQYLSTIDLDMVERIEIVRGTVSVLGSYALGGIINVITRKGPLGQQKTPVGGRLSSRFSSSDTALTGHGEAFGRTDKFRYFIGGTYRNSEDLRGGGDIGEQIATGYSEIAANLNFEYFISPEQSLAFRYQFLEQNEVPRTDRVTMGSNSLYNFDPQRLQLGTLAFEDLTDRGWINAFQLILSFNNQLEGRQEIRTSSPNTERFLEDEQTVLGLNLEGVTLIGDTHRLVWGTEYLTEKIYSSRNDLDLTTGVYEPKRGNYTDGAGYRTFAVYAQDYLSLTKFLSLVLGIRYNYYSASGEESSSVGDLNLDFHESDFTGTINAIFHASPNLNFIFNVTQGFRAPNIDDISVYDDRGSSGIEVPNKDVSSERIRSYELGLKYSNAEFSGTAFYYYSDLSDLLVRSTGTYNGQSYFIVDGETVPVLQKQNIGESRIQGVELDLSYHPNPIFTIFGNFTYTRGDDTIEDVPLRRIPPAFGTLGIRWSPRAKLKPWAEAVYHFATSQTRLNPGDIGDWRIGPDGTDGFNVFHLRGGVSLTNNIRVVMALENLLDEKYKYHGSGVYRPGRHFVVGAQFGFNK